MRMMSTIVVLAFLVSEGRAENSEPLLFEDQSQYELVYEFQYQNNFVERLIFECTADEEAWGKFAYAMAPISNAYRGHVLGKNVVFDRDIFTNEAFLSLVGQELWLNVTRSSKQLYGDPTQPVLMAQRDVLRIVETYSDNLAALCDFVFWEEVAYLEVLLEDLIEDAKARLESAESFREFLEDAEQGLPTLRRLFAANPFKEVRR